MKRLDWRFLLPDTTTGAPYRHLVLLGGSASMADAIVATRVAERVTTRLEPREPSDALVVLHTAGQRAWRAVDWLSPGGVVYWETSRPRRAQRELRRAGVRLTGQYWVRPSFEEADVYLPLDRSRALRWYLETMHVAATPSQRALEPALRLLARAGSGALERAAWQQALVGVRGARAGAGPALLAGADQRPIMLTPGDATRRVVLLPFGPGEQRPARVVKLARFTDLNAVTEDEQQVLNTLQRALDPALRASVPRPLGTFRWRELTVGLESCAPGQLLATSTQRWGRPLRRKIADLELVVAWLVRLYQAAPIARAVWDAAFIGKWLATPLANYDRLFGLTAEEQRLFEAARARARELVGQPMSVVWTNWALREPNIFRHPRGLVVVDWEGGGEALPGFDLLYFILDWLCSTRGSRALAAQVEALRDLFCLSTPPDTACLAARRVMTGFLADVGLDPRFLPMLLVALWVSRAVSHAERARNAERGRNHYTAYVEVLAGYTEQVFESSRSA